MNIGFNIYTIMGYKLSVIYIPFIWIFNILIFNIKYKYYDI